MSLDQRRVALWSVVGHSVQGAAHERLHSPNQDRINYLPVGATASTAFLSVSDGHGSAKCFRSGVGATFAVDIGTTELQRLLNPVSDPPTLSAIKRLAEENWPRKIVSLWNGRVQRHLEDEPFEEHEFQRMETEGIMNARDLVTANPTLAYGATLLSVIATTDFIIYLQLGDGDILTVSDTGEVSRPMTADNRLFANETTSLCGTEAWTDFRFSFQPVQESQPALILCSSDGYAGSFRTEADFLKVGSDLLTMIRTDGLATIQERLPDWLREASQMGSGDDVTLGLICRLPLTLEDGTSILRLNQPLEDDSHGCAA